MKIIVAIAFYFLYWGVCFLGTGTDKKNLMGLRSYPEEVQNRVRSDHQLGKAVPKRKSTAAVWLSNLLLFTVVFSALGLALRGVLNLDGHRRVSHADGFRFSRCGAGSGNKKSPHNNLNLTIPSGMALVRVCYVAIES